MTVCWTPSADRVDRALARLPWCTRAWAAAFTLLGFTESRAEQRLRARLRGR